MSAADDARSLLAAWQSGGVDAVAPLVHEEFVGEIGGDTSVEPGSYVGHEGVRRYFGLWAETMDDLELEITDAEDLAEGAAIARIRISGRGRGSGVPVSFEAWAAMVFRDGLLFRMGAGADRDAARSVARAAGG